MADCGVWGVDVPTAHCVVWWLILLSRIPLSTLSVWTACFSSAFLTSVCPWLRVLFSVCPPPSSSAPVSVMCIAPTLGSQHLRSGLGMVQTRPVPGSLSYPCAPVDCSNATSVTLRLEIFLVEGYYTCVLNTNNMQGSWFFLKQLPPWCCRVRSVP